MAINDVIKVKLESQMFSQVGLNIRHYRIDGEVTGGATMQEIADAMYTQFATDYASCLVSDAVFANVGVQKVRPLPMGVETLSSQAPTAGTVTGDVLPWQTSGLITLRTALAGRAFRGRAYIPFAGEARNGADGKPTSLHITNLGSVADDMLEQKIVVGAGGSTTLTPVIFQRGSGTTTALTSAVVRTAWATQRRRGGFGRPNIVT